MGDELDSAGGRGSQRPASLRGGDRVEREVIGLACDGVVTGADLRAAGLSRRVVDRCVQIALLRRIRRDLFVLAGCELEGRTACRAALAVGGTSALSHWTAAHLRGLLPTGPRAVHVSIASRGSIADAWWAQVHPTRSLRDDEWSTVGGLRTTTVPRTLRDLAAHLPSAPWADDQLARLLGTALRTRTTSRRALERQIEAERSPRLRRRLDGLVLQASGGVGHEAAVRSIGEAWVVAAAARCGLPTPSCNVWLNGFEADAYWPVLRLNVEFDGFAFHRERRAHDRDRRRDRLLLAAGVNVIRLTSTDFRDVAEVERELRTLAALPAPGPAPGVPVAVMRRHGATRGGAGRER